MGKLLNLEGKKYNRLTAIRRVGTNKDGKALWLCKCDCGNEKVVSGTALMNGRTKSCGCIIGEKVRQRCTTHGLHDTRVYHIWKAMRQRCYYKKGENYKRYGGRGIVICDEWKNDFKLFYNWAINNGYKENLTIERKDIDGNYCPENCEWISNREQGINKRTTKWVKVNGKTNTMSGWARELGLNIGTIFNAEKQGYNMQEYIEFKLENPNKIFRKRRKCNE